MSRREWILAGGLALAIGLLGCASPQPPGPAAMSAPPSVTASPTQDSVPAVESSPATEVRPPSNSQAGPGYLDSLPAQHSGRRPTRSEIAAVVRKFAARENPDAVIAKVRSIKVARDTRGRYWVSATAVPVRSDRYDNALLYLYKQGATWRLQDLGTNLDVDALPEDVRSRL